MMKTKKENTPKQEPVAETGKQGSPPVRRLTRYLRELSVVVAGVAITFIVSGWINRQNEKKETERNLSAVKTELADNLEIIREATVFYENTALFSQYLTSDVPERLSPDSILKYRELRVTGEIYNLTYKTSAFEILQKSESLNRVKDKTLLQSILNSYASLAEIKYASDNYMKRKLDEIYNAVTKNRQVRFDLLAPGFSDLFYFFALYYQMDVELRECSRQLEETLDQF